MKVDSTKKNMKVEILSRKLIKPSTPTPPHLRTYKLSLFDQLAPTAYVTIILYYSSDGNVGEVENAERCIRLEKSLSEVLTKFYPLAGRISKDELLVDCNDQGVDYLEAQVSGVLDEFLSGKPETTELLDQFVPLDIGPADSITSPLLVVQVNSFICRGLVVGLRISHKLVDASAFATFINGWATASRVGIGGVISPSLDLAAHLPTRTSLGFKVPPPTNSRPKLVMKRFVFNRASILVLRDKVRGSSIAHQPTRVMVVTALLWKALIRIARSKHGQLRGSISTHMVNLRGKTGLQIPENSFGNLVTVFTVRFNAGERRLEFEDLAGLFGDAVRNSKASFATKLQGEELYSMWFEHIKERVKEMKEKSEVDFPLFSSWSRFPLYETDFGWGKPCWVSIASGDVEVSVLMDTKCGDGIEAWVNLKEEDMIELERDTDILAFTSCS